MYNLSWYPVLSNLTNYKQEDRRDSSKIFDIRQMIATGPYSLVIWKCNRVPRFFQRAPLGRWPGDVGSDKSSWCGRRHELSGRRRRVLVARSASVHPVIDGAAYDSFDQQRPH